VANVSVPHSLREFPIFRCGLENPATGKVDEPWLWDGEREWRAGTLTDEQKKFPIRQIVNDTMLITMIEKGSAD
jgi:hypothetical protein